MSGATFGVVGVVLGITFGGLGLLLGRRAGAGALGVGKAGPHSVEREIVRRASALAFPVYVLAVCLHVGLVAGSGVAGVAAGLAGLIFGAASAVSSHRLGGR